MQEVLDRPAETEKSPESQKTPEKQEPIVSNERMQDIRGAASQARKEEQKNPEKIADLKAGINEKFKTDNQSFVRNMNMRDSLQTSERIIQPKRSVIERLSDWIAGPSKYVGIPKGELEAKAKEWTTHVEKAKIDKENLDTEQIKVGRQRKWHEAEIKVQRQEKIGAEANKKSEEQTERSAKSEAERKELDNRWETRFKEQKEINRKYNEEQEKKQKELEKKREEEGKKRQEKEAKEREEREKNEAEARKKDEEQKERKAEEARMKEEQRKRDEDNSKKNEEKKQRRNSSETPRDENEDEYRRILGVSRTATQEEIRTAFLKKAQELHPDKTKGNKKLENELKEASGAWDYFKRKDREKIKNARK